MPQEQCRSASRRADSRPLVVFGLRLTAGELAKTCRLCVCVYTAAPPIQLLDQPLSKKFCSLVSHQNPPKKSPVHGGVAGFSRYIINVQLRSTLFFAVSNEAGPCRYARCAPGLPSEKLSLSPSVFLSRSVVFDFRFRSIHLIFFVFRQ